MKRDKKQVLTELLIYKAQGGDERAFADLYELWRIDILKFARSLLNDRDGMEEASQEAWVAIARSLRRLEDPARFRAWAFCLLRRKCVDWIRKSARDRKREKEFLNLSEENAAQTPQRESDAKTILIESIQKLDTNERLLLHCYYEQGLSMAELSETFEIPVGTVKSRLHAVRETLRTLIERK